MRFFLVLLLISLTATAQQKRPVDYVNSLIGSAPSTTESARRHSEAGSELKGQISPAIGHPHGMTSWTPQTRRTETKCIAPYYYTDSKINGFRGSHWLNGSCVQDYGTVTLMPFSGTPTTRPESSFSHDQERVTPSYYSVALPDYQVKAQLTATPRSGLLEFQFQKEEKHFVLIEPNSDEGQGFLEIHPERREIVGYNPVHRIYQGAGQSAGISGYFVIQFDTPFEDYGTFETTTIHFKRTVAQAKGNAVGAILAFPTQAGTTVRVRVGTSFTDLDGARRNLAAEIPHWNLTPVRKTSEAAWNRELGRVSLQGAEADQSLFYTALYHTKLTPRLYSDVDGRYPGFANDTTIHTAKGFDYYCDFSLWDTFRAGLPLHALLEPERSASLMQSFTKMGEQGGWMPIFPCWNHYTAAMIGDHVLSAVADAYVKGIRNFDVETAYRYLRKNAFEVNTNPKSYEAGQGRRALKSYLQYQYIPLEDSVWQAFHKREQTSRTLEYAYDDFCLAQLAKALNRSDDYNALIKRAQNYRNVIDPQTGWARGRYADGRWSEKFDPFALRVGFITEGSPAQYTWFVPQDVQGLVQQVGGRERFLAKLDTMFEKGYYWHGNEPGNHTAYLYAWAGQPYKTQKWVRQLIRDEYGLGPGGLSGNEDGGQMSAWLAFSMLGFYPVCPGRPEYVLGSPSFTQASLHLSNGKTFTIKARGNSSKNIYIQNATLNGKTFTKTFLTHAQILAGGTLELTMGEQPNRGWGQRPSDRPTSLTP
ncbi:GH92 family glycosyl hydrolase [Siphonobacter sp.]|uniref:GH92 family glycosyl hydrolase n=1 Tax=Siphonobacter sp. TaxID=1869184 RepID=UPI003B3B00CD